MPIFAHIECEAEIQLDDRIRLDASKTHVTRNQPAISKLQIQPGLDEAQYSVYDSVVSKRYLDWEFSSWTIDVDATNNKIDFNEGGSDLAATLSGGTYNISQLATEIQTQLNASTTAPLTYTVSVIGQDQIKIQATGLFSLLIKTGTNKAKNILRQLSFGTDDLDGELSYTGNTVEYLTKKITTIAGENVYQVQKVTCVADVSGSLNSKYFILYGTGDTDKFYIWYNVSGGGVDPSLSGFTGLSVAISTNDTASTIATATASVINATTQFDAAAVGSIITITHTTYDWNTAALEGLGTGFTFSVFTQGQQEDSESTYTKVYSIDGDYLFSDDSDLMQFEPDIRKWVQDGRNSFINVHRQAQKHILEWLDRQGYTNSDNEKYTKFDFLDVSEVKEWSRFIVLRMIFEGIKNSQDDLFKQKTQIYSDKEMAARDRMVLRIRKSSTDTTTSNINVNHSVSLIRQ